jgi:hypothetical protein
VTYSAQGFQEKIVDAVEQTVAHTRTLDVVLSVAGSVGCQLRAYPELQQCLPTTRGSSTAARGRIEA